jgi:dynein heavy chain
MLPELIAQFEDYFLRISVLKTNPHIKSFVDKLVELEKTIKTVVDQVNEWAAFQRNFIYLYGIFSLEEMRKSMPSESGLFRNIKTIFVKATQEFKEYKEVHRITSKDNFLNVLVKGNADCEIIRKSLVSFLEKKRGKFPRLFFLSNEELIDIFGKGSNLVQHMVDSDNHAFV